MKEEDVQRWQAALTEARGMGRPEQTPAPADHGFMAYAAAAGGELS